MLWLAREHPTSTPEYFAEPPDDASPALAYGLAHEGEDSNNTVLATLLDLVERGYYDTKNATTATRSWIWRSRSRSKRPSRKLEPYEQDTLDFFDELVGDETVAAQRDEDTDPRAQRHLAGPLGEDDRLAERRRRGPAASGTGT